MQASPKVLVQILVTGTRILGKAFFEAGRQAVKSLLGSKFLGTLCIHRVPADAKHSPQGALASDVTGVGNASTGSITDQLTRQHRMTIDEANLILNVKREDTMEQILKVVRSIIMKHVAAHSTFRVMTISSKQIHQDPSQINPQPANSLLHHTPTIFNRKCFVLGKE